jgi:hypothetical protein
LRRGIKVKSPRNVQKLRIRLNKVCTLKWNALKSGMDLHRTEETERTKSNYAKRRNE